MSKTSSTSRTGKPVLRRKSSASPAQASTSDNDQSTPANDEATRRAMIAEAAYYRAERRGFAPGSELEDWLLSENEVDAQAPTRIQQQRLEKSTPSSTELH